MRNVDSQTTRKLTTPARLQHDLKLFLSVLAILVSARTIPTLLAGKRRNSKGKHDAILTRKTIQISLLPVLLPRTYAFLRHRLGPSVLAELLSSPLLLLLPQSWRINSALYAASSALYHSATKTSKLRRYLPPIWTLNVLGNVVLLWAFVFKSEAFPSAYERVIIANSTHYIPPELPKPELEAILQNATFERSSSPSPSKHIYELCTKLHPSEPSCMMNYLKAWISESSRTVRWVGAFSMLPIVLSKARRNAAVRDPLQVFRRWLTSTLSGTAFITGSITTSWAMTCFLQRVLPNNRLRHARWMINASISSLWILMLPEKRRVEISLYVARVSVLCAWRLWRLAGGPALPFGDVILLALSWIQLVKLQRGGERISGLVGFGMAKFQEGMN